MKKLITTFGLLLILSQLSAPVLGAPAPKSTDRKLSDLTNRFNSFEANWGRFQLGGNFSIESQTNLEPNGPISPLFKINQQVSLFLDASVDQNLMFSLKMSHRGGWGLSYQNLDSQNIPLDSPVVSPLQIDEAFLRIEHQNSLHYLGRFRYSFGPFGLVSDFFTNPAEGLAYQRSFGDFHVVGFYSRVYTQYTPGTDQVEISDNYLAGRIGWSNRNSIFGINLIPYGVTGEKNIGFDWSTASPNSALAAELAWYSFQSDQFPDYQVDWTPGLLVSYKKQISKNDLFQVKAGYFSPNFTPSYSSLAHASGDDREWFLPNSRGMDFYLLKDLSPKLQLANHVILLNPIKDYGQPEFGYRLRTSVVKSYSPVNRLEVGIDLKNLTETPENNLFINWTIQF